ncbi:MAG: hypothetical protein HFI41_11485 [Lachnospiraceae bacterium]|nr:hypothetical protein [Lachnospiraceae bacterium]
MLIEKENQVEEIVKSFCDLLQGILSKHFDKLDSQVRLYLYQRRAGEETWTCLIPETDQGCSLYEDVNEDFKDSRTYRACSRYELRWSWTGTKKCQSIKFILKVATDELLVKIKDMLYLERISEVVRELEKEEEREKNSLYQYFFGNLLNKEWMVRQYVALSLKEYKLPDWRIFIQLSAMMYEKRTISTCMYFLEEEEELKADYQLRFVKGNDLLERMEDQNVRSIRKLMELAGSKQGLVVRKPDYIVEGTVNNENSKNLKSCVEFGGHMAWKLKLEGEVIFEYNKGGCKLPELESKNNKEKQLEKVKYIYCSEKRKEKIRNTIKRLCKVSSHGASIVFMEREKLFYEVKRLSRYHRAYWVEGVDLDTCSDLEGILAIDGAILADLDCMCYAVGAILDGEITIEGRSDRGARYNSVVNYVHAIKKKYSEGAIDFHYCAAIISEDETLDVEIL